MKKIIILVLSVTLFALLAGCAPGTSVQVNTPSDTLQLSAPGVNPLVNQGDTSGRVARAGAGLWHGIIAPITLILSFFSSDIRMYEVHNAGAEYDLGFLLGVGLIFLILGFLIRMRR
jgi:hypothetical protein